MKCQKPQTTPAAAQSRANLPPSRGLHIQDAARYLGVTTCFIRALIATSEIPFIQAGKRHILDVKDLDAWLESRKEKMEVRVAA